MINENEINLALKAATKAAWYEGRGQLDHDTCVSEANEAVARAMRTYDPNKGSSLSTYSANRARWQARNLLRKGSRNVAKPVEWFDALPSRTTTPLRESFEGLELRIATLWAEYRYSYRQISALTGVSCVRVNAIMKQVRTRLLAYEGIRNSQRDYAVNVTCDC